MIANVMPGWRSGAAAAGIATLVLGTLTLRLNVQHDKVLSAIAEAAHRPSRARLSGRYPYREYKPRPDLRLLRVALTSQRPQPESVSDFHVAGVTALVGGQPSHAVSLLGRAADLADAEGAVPRRHAEILNDLAVAHYESARRGSVRNLIIGFNAAQKAWTLDPTPATAWTRAVLLEELGGARLASDAWDDYLKLDSASLWSREVRHARTSRAAAPQQECDVAAPMRHVSAWAEAVRGGDSQAEARERTSLRSHAEARALAGDTFLDDVIAWLAESVKDPARKMAAANAVLPLGWSRYRPHDPERARHELHALQSPLATFAALSRASDLVRLGRVDEASSILGPTNSVCADRPAYLNLCARRRWIEAEIEARRGRLFEALIHYDQVYQQFAQAGNTRCAARVLLRRAAVLVGMRSSDEAWTNRIQATRLSGAATTAPDESILTNLAVAATRDGYFHTAEYLFSRVTPSYSRASNDPMAKYESARRVSWLTFAQMQIAGNPAHADILSDEVMRRFAASTRHPRGQEAHANFASFRRDVVNVSVEGFGAVTIASRSDWTAPVDTFGPEHEERDAIANMVAESVRQLYQRDSRTDVMYGSPEAALWLSDRARRVGIPQASEPECLGKRSGRSPEELGRKLIDCVPRGVTIIQQDLDFARKRLYTWVIRRGQVQLTQTRVSVPELIADITRFSREIEGETNAVSLRAQAQHLYDVLLQPVEQQLAGTDLLVYSPDQTLRVVPIAALHDGSRLLIEKRPIATTPSISMFELDPQLPSAPSALVVLPTPSDARAVLPGAEREVREVASVYQRSALLRETTATPKRFLEFAPAHDILHVATHGQTRGGSYQNSIEFGRERIRAYDIFTLDLNKRKPIVMLAACRTADSSGGSMNVSLTDAFLAAGASAVVGTLWDVEDRPTEQLSIAFHRELAKGATPYDALRRVQLQFIRQGRPLSTWAAFQVSS